jgi:hypothetical protein
MLFLTAYFLQKDRKAWKNLPSLFQSFLAVPAGVMFYLALAYFFGSIDNALLQLLIDAFRSVPRADLLIIVFYFIRMLTATFPLSWLFLSFIMHSPSQAKNNPAISLMCLLAFILPLSRHFLFWYVIVAVPGLAIFVARSIHATESGRLSSAVIAFLALLSLAAYAFLLFPVPYPADMRELAEFSKGKKLVFLEHILYENWAKINEKYLGTDKSFLLVEQTYPGFLFYRFNDRADFQNVSVAVGPPESAPCDVYVVSRAGPPPCLKLIRNVSGFPVYGPG